MWQQVQMWAMSEHGSKISETKNKQTSRKWWLLSIACPIRGYPQVPSQAHLWSMAFEALGWCQQPALPIDGERSGEVWRVLGTVDA